MMRSLLLFAVGFTVLSLSACKDEGESAAKAPEITVPVLREAPPAPQQQQADDTVADTTGGPISGDLATDPWLGLWPGPEEAAAALEIRRDEQGAYSIVITTAGSAQTYPAQSAGNGLISFTRDGAAEEITAGNGDDTGIPAFAGRENCLVIKHGEGFCRR